MEFDKPFKNFEEQLSLLKDKNIFFEDTKFVMTCLESYSYYSLINGFKDLFGVYIDTEKNIEVFPKNTNFSTLYGLYLLDSNLNSLLFKYILGVERSFKTKLSHVIAEKYGVDSDENNPNSFLNFRLYRNTQDLDRKTEIEKIIKQINMTNRSLSIDHYRQNHNHIPPWIVVNGLLFGTIINWYKILKSDVKEMVANKHFTYTTNLTLKDKLKLLPDTLSLLQKYRNNMAHGNRTFSTSLNKELSKNELLKALDSSILTEAEFLSGLGKKDLFAVMIAIVLLTDDINQLQFFVSELHSLFNLYLQDGPIKLSPKGDIFATLEIPEDYDKKLLNLIKLKTQ